MLNKQLRNKKKLERGLLHKPGAVKMLFCDSSPGVVKWAADAWEVTDLTHWDAESGQPSFEKKKQREGVRSGEMLIEGQAAKSLPLITIKSKPQNETSSPWLHLTPDGKKSLAMCNYPVKAEAMDNQILKAAGWWGLLSINQSL